MDEDRNAAEMRILETDLDDATPEILGRLPDRLRDAGARHVSILPMTTKESRPGHLVRAVVRPADVDAVARRLARETGSLGVRALPATHAFVAETDRRVVGLEVAGEHHDVGVKVGWIDDEVYDVSAEHDAAATVAAATNLTTREVTERAEAGLGGLDSGFVVHLVERSTWEAMNTDTEYPAADQAGGIPCATPARIADVASSLFETDHEVLAIVIDPRTLSSPVSYDLSASGHQAEITGPMQREAIVAVHDVPAGPDGFGQPPEVATHASSSSR